MLPAFTDAAMADRLGYTVTDAALLRASIRVRTYLLSVGYPDPDPVPDGLVELVCAIAQRLDAMPQALVEGRQQQSQGAAGGFSQSVGFGWDAWKAKSGLDAGELAELHKMFPRLPRSISMGSPVDLHLDDA